MSDLWCGMLDKERNIGNRINQFEIRLYKKDGWKFVLIYLLFQNVLQNSFGGPLGVFFAYSDEMIAVAIVLLMLYRACTSHLRLDRSDQIIIVLLVVFEAIGILSGLLYRYQSTVYMLVDAFTCAKFLIFYLGAKILTAGQLRDGYCNRILNKFSRIMAVVFFTLTVHDLFLPPFFEKRDFRYFTYSIQLFFEHPTFLARTCATLIFILAYNMKYGEKNMPYILFLEFVMFMTFRNKAIAASIVILLIYFYAVKFRMHSKFLLVAASLMVALYIGMSAFEKYYGDQGASSPRYIMTMDAIALAAQYFPLGTGFGSFGSSMAVQHYSKLYVELGYNTMSALGTDSVYLSDTFWPTVMAQTGWIGLFCFIGIVLVLLQIAWQYMYTDIYMFWTAISILAYDLISSTAEPAFFHPTTMGVYLVFGLIVSETNASSASKKIRGKPGGFSWQKQE